MPCFCKDVLLSLETTNRTPELTIIRRLGFPPKFEARACIDKLYQIYKNTYLMTVFLIFCVYVKNLPDESKIISLLLSCQ